MQTPLSEVIAEKGADYYCIGPDASVSAAVSEMNRRGIGSLLVVKQGTLLGIITERDVLVRLVATRADPDLTLVRQVMTPDPLTVAPSVTVEDAMLLVTRHRHRHLPVVTSGRIHGLVSIGDLTRWMVRDREHEIDHLRQYISGSQSQPGMHEEQAGIY